MTQRLYRDDPYLLEFEARVVGRREHEGRPAVVLDRTAFYAESGGQPWDLGHARGRSRARGGRRGRRDPARAGPSARRRRHRARPVDAARRRDHRAAAPRPAPPLARVRRGRQRPRTVSFHLGAEESTIDLDREVDERTVREAGAPRQRDRLGGAPGPVRVGLPRRGRRPRRHRPRGSGRRGAPGRGRGLRPPGLRRHPSAHHLGGRAWSWSWATSGTRAAAACASSAATAPSRRSTLRASLLARPGRRLLLVDRGPARRRTPRRGRGSPRARRSATRLLERALEGEAHRLLAARPPRVRPVVVATYDGWPAADLRLARPEADAARALRRAPRQPRGQGPPRLRADARAWATTSPPSCARPWPALGGRGGGKGDLAQGGGERVDRLDEALAAAARARSRARPPPREAPSVATASSPSPSLCVSVGSIFVRLAARARPGRGVLPHLPGLALLAPFAAPSLRARLAAPSPRGAALVAPRLRRRPGRALRHLDRQPVLHLGGRLRAAREHGPALHARSSRWWFLGERASSRGARRDGAWPSAGAALIAAGDWGDGGRPRSRATRWPWPAR